MTLAIRVPRRLHKRIYINQSGDTIQRRPFWAIIVTIKVHRA